MEIEYVRGLTNGLEERERNILYSHYGLGRPAQTLAQIAGPLGVSTERVRQIEEQALKKLRMAAAAGTPPQRALSERGRDCRATMRYHLHARLVALLSPMNVSILSRSSPPAR